MNEKYLVTLTPANAFGIWVNSGIFCNSMKEARIHRREVASGVGLPLKEVVIKRNPYNEKAC